jgi:hypothetical protein
MFKVINMMTGMPFWGIAPLKLCLVVTTWTRCMVHAALPQGVSGA